MAARKRKIAPAMPQRHQKKCSAQAFYTPFKDLDQQLTFIPETCVSPSPVPEKTSAPVALPEDPESLFRKAMADVEPFRGGATGRIPPPPPAKRPPRFMMQENAEVLSAPGRLGKRGSPF